MSHDHCGSFDLGLGVNSSFAQAGFRKIKKKYAQKFVTKKPKFRFDKRLNIKKKKSIENQFGILRFEYEFPYSFILPVNLINFQVIFKV